MEKFSNKACLAAWKALGLPTSLIDTAKMRAALNIADRIARDEADIPIRLAEDFEPKMFVAIDLAGGPDIGSISIVEVDPNNVLTHRLIAAESDTERWRGLAEEIAKLEKNGKITRRA